MLPVVGKLNWGAATIEVCVCVWGGRVNQIRWKSAHEYAILTDVAASPFLFLFPQRIQLPRLKLCAHTRVSCRVTEILACKCVAYHTIFPYKYTETTTTIRETTVQAWNNNNDTHTHHTHAHTRTAAQWLCMPQCTQLK